ncbi:MAG: FHA domain-containing protein [Chloroflexota bacterium]
MRANFLLDYDVLTVDRPQKLYLMARFEAGKGPDDKIRRPLNLSLVIDRSGSMAGDKIDYTRQAAQFLVQHLGANDTLSIVLYNDKVETLLAPEVVSNKDSVSQLLERIRVRGTTNLSGGWLEGCRHVKQSLSSKAMNRVLLMSDGLANRGVTDQAQLVSMAKQKRNEGVTTTTMGLGKDFNEDLMMEMANAGGGAFYFIESPEVTPTIFQEELSGLLSVVGQNLSITIETTDAVRALRQLNAYSVNIDPPATTFQLGDIFAHEVKTLVLELAIPALEKTGQTDIATLRFEYDEIEGDKTTHHIDEFPVSVNIIEPEDVNPSANEDVQASVLLLQAANARREAVNAADRGLYDRASSVLREAAQSISDSQILSSELQEEELALREQADKLEKGASSYDQYSRKTMSTQALYTMTSRHDDTMMLRRREHERDGKTNKPEERVITSEQQIPTTTGDHTAIPPQKGVPPTHVTYKDKVYTLDSDLMRIGRASQNEIVIDEKGVSRFHAEIRKNGDKVLIEDLDSTNGSTIDGKPLKDSHELSIGDVVFVCDEKLVFHSQTD